MKKVYFKRPILFFAHALAIVLVLALPGAFRYSMAQSRTPPGEVPITGTVKDNLGKPVAVINSAYSGSYTQIAELNAF